MDAIFGKIDPPELLSSQNGLVMSAAIEKYFDSGVFVIVPEVPDRSTRTLFPWKKQEVRDYKVRIIDPEWEMLDMPIDATTLTWRDLNNRKFQFRGEQRPAERYLFFHYCVQALRRCWRAVPGDKPHSSLEDESGKSFWDMPGKYIPKNMLRELISHTYADYRSNEVIIGASSKRGRDETLIDAAVAQIAEYEHAENDRTESNDEWDEI